MTVKETTHVHGHPLAADVHVRTLGTIEHEPQVVGHVVVSAHSDHVPPVGQQDGCKRVGVAERAHWLMSWAERLTATVVVMHAGTGGASTLPEPQNIVPVM